MSNSQIILGCIIVSCGGKLKLKWPCSVSLSWRLLTSNLITRHCLSEVCSMIMTNSYLRCPVSLWRLIGTLKFSWKSQAGYQGKKYSPCRTLCMITVHLEVWNHCSMIKGETKGDPLFLNLLRDTEGLAPQAELSLLISLCFVLQGLPSGYQELMQQRFLIILLERRFENVIFLIFRNFHIYLNSFFINKL